MFHHKSIKRFSMRGTLYDEADIDRLKREYLALLVLEMRADGYVVRSDIDPDFTINYLGPRDGFAFILSIYGVYIGKRKAQKVDYIHGYKPLYVSDRESITKVKESSE